MVFQGTESGRTPESGPVQWEGWAWLVPEGRGAAGTGQAGMWAGIRSWVFDIFSLWYLLTISASKRKWPSSLEHSKHK